jgi:hypothetical protein
VTIAPATTAASVLFKPGVGNPPYSSSLIAGGSPELAALVTNCDASGLILCLRVMPPDGPSVNVMGVRHVSVAGPTEQSWSYPAAAAGGSTTVFQKVLTIDDALSPVAWTPLPCLAGQLNIIEMGSATPSYWSTEFYMGAAFPTTPPSDPFSKTNGSAGFTPLIQFTGLVGTLTVSTFNYASPTNFRVTIYSAGV